MERTAPSRRTTPATDTDPTGSSRCRSIRQASACAQVTDTPADMLMTTDSHRCPMSAAPCLPVDRSVPSTRPADSSEVRRFAAIAAGALLTACGLPDLTMSVRARLRTDPFYRGFRPGWSMVDRPPSPVAVRPPVSAKQALGPRRHEVEGIDRGLNWCADVSRPDESLCWAS